MSLLEVWIISVTLRQDVSKVPIVQVPIFQVNLQCKHCYCNPMITAFHGGQLVPAREGCPPLGEDSSLRPRRLSHLPHGVQTFSSSALAMAKLNKSILFRLLI